MDNFDELLSANRTAVERFVRYRISRKEDAEDILQNVYLSAYQKFAQLKNKEVFKAWILSIARNQCNDFFRKTAKNAEVLIGSMPETMLVNGRHGRTEYAVVYSTMENLEDNDRQILFLYYWKELSQMEISCLLHIPIGTVKSRLHTAKQRFKKYYPDKSLKRKEGFVMRKIPDMLPDYTIREVEDKPFTVKWEELMGWFLVPREGECLEWGIYDVPSGKCDCCYEMKAEGKAIVHGIEGVKVNATEINASTGVVNARTFIAQLTDSHCRYLAMIQKEEGVERYVTFLDGEEFLANWGYGEDNCGKAINLSAKGEIERTGKNVVTKNELALDIVGRYEVTINGKTYDTICVMDIETYNGNVVTEQYLDKNGRTILWRRFNRDDWRYEQSGQLWSEQLPENERITVNGQMYVHWYDCITDYICK